MNNKNNDVLNDILNYTLNDTINGTLNDTLNDVLNYLHTIGISKDLALFHTSRILPLSQLRTS